MAALVLAQIVLQLTDGVVILQYAMVAVIAEEEHTIVVQPMIVVKQK
jgi:hypothetical protein